jgi:hypothetical protein
MAYIVEYQEPHDSSGNRNTSFRGGKAAPWHRYGGTYDTQSEAVAVASKLRSHGTYYAHVRVRKA